MPSEGDTCMALTYCSSCHQIDEQPKHILQSMKTGEYPVDQQAVNAVLGDPSIPQEDSAAIIADIYDTASDRKHLMCCATDGCPTNTCKEN